MMTADDVIQFYVRDVASYLPRKKRNDVAFELRALLQDELAAKASAQGRAPDEPGVVADAVRRMLDAVKGLSRHALTARASAE